MARRPGRFVRWLLRLFGRWVACRVDGCLLRDGHDGPCVRAPEGR